MCYVGTGITTMPATTTTEVDTIPGKQNRNIITYQNVTIYITIYFSRSLLGFFSFYYQRANDCQTAQGRLSSDVCLLLSCWYGPERVREVAWRRAGWWLALVLCCCLLSIITNHWPTPNTNTQHTRQTVKWNANEDRKWGVLGGHISRRARRVVSYSRLMTRLRGCAPVWPWLLGNRLHPAPVIVSWLCGLSAVCWGTSYDNMRAERCRCVCEGNAYLCMYMNATHCSWVNTYLSDFSFLESQNMHANQFCVFVFVLVCLCSCPAL